MLELVTRDEGLLDENAVADVENLFGEMRHIGNLKYTIHGSEYEDSSPLQCGTILYHLKMMTVMTVQW